VLALAFSADGRRLISGSRDTTALVWDVAGVLPAALAVRLDEAEVRELWAALSDADGAVALKAVCRLARAPEQSLPYIRAHLGKEPAADPERLARLVADLDADEFAARQAASVELARLGKLAEAALKRALENMPSPEVRRRAEALLKRLEEGKAASAELQTRRAVEVLERIATPEARTVIEALAKETGNPRVAEEARATLDRLTRR
jgi:hypothetical protein